MVNDLVPERVTICHTCYRPYPVSILPFHLISHHDLYDSDPSKFNFFLMYDIDPTVFSNSVSSFKLLDCEKKMKVMLNRLIRMSDDLDFSVLEVPQFQYIRKHMSPE